MLWIYISCYAWVLGITHGHPFSKLFDSRTSMQKSYDAIVVGSGLSGATAAFYLDRLGLDVLLIEERNNVGGNVRSKQVDGYIWEEGPNSFQPSPSILNFASDLGIIEKLVLANASLPRYIYWNDRLHALPTKVVDFLKSQLLSSKGKLRLVFGLLGFIAKKPTAEESIKEFSIRHFGEEVFTRIIDPFVSGVYAGDPEKLSMSAALPKLQRLEDIGRTRSILSGISAKTRQRKASASNQSASTPASSPSGPANSSRVLPVVPPGSLGSFSDGMQAIPLAVQERLKGKVLVSHSLRGIRHEADGQWTCTLETLAGTTTMRTKALLLTCPAYVTASLLASCQTPNAYVAKGLKRAAQALTSVHYPPIASVVMSYPDSALKVPLDGFGHLIPRQAKVRSLGTIWASTLFKNRAPPGSNVIVNFMGGAQDPEVALLSPQQIVEQTHEDLKRVILHQNASPGKRLGVRTWLKAIPQYNRGHSKLVGAISSEVEKFPGLFLCGNYLTGVAIGDCIESGRATAEKIFVHLTES